MTENKVGRPSAVTPKILEKLEEAFKLGCTNREACFYADLAESTFYDFLKSNPEFSEKIDIWKQYLKIQSRAVIKVALDNCDKDTAKWYLERKAKDEFSTKQEVEHSGEINNPLKGLTTEELREIIKQGGNGV